jgi:excisionase family DNA binding protein
VSERLLTAAEVAELLSVPVSWVREATRAERIPYVALGRYRRYSRQAIESWLLEQRGGPLASPRRTGSLRPNELGMRS